MYININKYYLIICLILFLLGIYLPYKLNTKFEYIIHHFVTNSVIILQSSIGAPEYWHCLVAEHFYQKSSTIFLNNCWL